MHIPTWRLVLAGGAITILAVAGLGLVAGSTMQKLPASNVVVAAPAASGAPVASGKPDRPGSAPKLGTVGERLGGARLLRLGRRLVHAEVTVTDKDGKLILLQLDHGTVQTVGDGSLTIAEQGGKTEVVSTDDGTIVRVGREAGHLSDVTVGADVFVQSRIDGGSPLAKRILIVPAAAS